MADERRIWMVVAAVIFTVLIFSVLNRAMASMKTSSAPDTTTSTSTLIEYARDMVSKCERGESFVASIMFGAAAQASLRHAETLEPFVKTATVASLREDATECVKRSLQQHQNRYAITPQTVPSI